MKKRRGFALIIILLYMITAPSVEFRSENTLATSECSIDTKLPEIVASYEPQQIELADGSNIGLLMNASASIQDIIPYMDWTNIGGGISRTTSPWIMQLPGRMNGVNWFLNSATIQAKELYHTGNYIPNSGTAVYFEQSSSAWNYPTPKNYEDHYWGTELATQFASKTQNINPALGYVPAGTGTYYMPGSLDFGDLSGGSAYIQLNPAIRNFTYSGLTEKSGHEHSISFKNSTLDSSPTPIPFNCNWGYDETIGIGTPTYYLMGNNSIYSANRAGPSDNPDPPLESDNSTLIDYIENFGYGTNLGIVDDIIFGDDQVAVNFTQNQYWGLYYNYQKQTADNSYQAKAFAGWDFSSLF